MTRSWGGILLGLICTGCVQAQLDLLTLREAESIVETIPEVASAKANGKCPQLSVSFWDADQLWFQARYGCGPTGGMLIGNYILNRRTGDAITTGDRPMTVGGPQTKAVARQLVRQAQNRVLSANESRCLALEAAKGLPEWGGTDASVSVEERKKSRTGRLEYSAHRSSLIRSADSWRIVSVDKATAHVRDDETGLDIASQGLGSLASKILALRDPPWLSDEDAISIAFRIPSVVAEIRGGCTLSAVGALRSDETQVGLSCGDRQVPSGTVVDINLRTGHATDAVSGKLLDYPNAALLARTLLEGIRKRRADLQRAVEALCDPGAQIRPVADP